MEPVAGGDRELGQFFTPRAVIDFALDALRSFGGEIAGGSLIDPACGPGEWLEAGLVAGARPVVGLDCDPAMLGHWQTAGLSSRRDCLLLVADALIPTTLPAASFDLVVGNPPFGARIDGRTRGEVREIARHYSLFHGQDRARLIHEPSASDLERVNRFPPELLFLERFVELARPGARIAIILPEGVMANNRWRHARTWLLGKVTLHAVVGLPRRTFRASATTARTCLLLMSRRPSPRDHPVALAEIDDLEEHTVYRLLQAFATRASIADDPPGGLLPPPLFR